MVEKEGMQKQLEGFGQSISDQCAALTQGTGIIITSGIIISSMHDNKVDVVYRVNLNAKLPTVTEKQG